LLDSARERLKFLQPFLLQRKTGPKCLLCSSDLVQRVTFDRPQDEGEDVRSDSLHPGCGGRIMMETRRNNGFRIAKRFYTIRLYNAEGQFIGETPNDDSAR
jgi:hypothetical protein